METKEQHCQRGGTNPADESFPECEGCGYPIYDEEAITDVNGSEMCPDCIAYTIAEGLSGYSVHPSIVGGKHTFTLTEVKK